jgi:hypothetical protein
MQFFRDKKDKMLKLRKQLISSVKKVIALNINLYFFSQIYLFHTFYMHFEPKYRHYFSMLIQIYFIRNSFKYLHLFKDLPNNTTAAFCVLCGPRYSFDSLQNFVMRALYFVRPL